MKKLLSIGLCFIMLVSLSACSKDAGYEKAGNRNFKKGNYEAAASYYDKATKANPNRADYVIDYGLALLAQGKYDDAIKQFDSVYIKANMSIVKENNKRLLRGKGIAYYQMHNYQKALKEFDKALKIDELPKLNVDILYYMGNAYRSTGNYKKAIDTYNTLLKSDKKNANAYSNRALCYQNMDRYEESLTDYNKTITLEPNQFSHYLGKYNLLIKYNKDTEAKEVLTVAAKIKEKTKSDQYNLAKIRFYQGDYDAAINQLEASYKAGFKEAYYYIGEVYQIKKDYKKALYYYEKAINSGEITSSEVYNQAAVCLIKTGDYNKALEYVQSGIAFDDVSTIQMLKKNEIVIYEYMSEYDKAEEALQNYLKIYPDDKEAAREAEFVSTRIVGSVTQ